MSIWLLLVLAWFTPTPIVLAGLLWYSHRERRAKRAVAHRELSAEKQRALISERVRENA